MRNVVFAAAILSFWESIVTISCDESISSCPISQELEEQCGWGRAFWGQRFSGRCATLPLCCTSNRDIESLKIDGISRVNINGGMQLLTSPNTVPFIMPLKLKLLPIQEWSDEDRIWLNTTYKPWPDDEYCEKFENVFSINEPRPTVGLFSFPNSGNTMTRRLIESITGIFSGSFYFGACYPLAGFHGESLPFDSGFTSVIKGHGHYSPLGMNKNTGEFSSPNATLAEMLQTNGTAILLIRNPYKAIYGYRHYLSAGGIGYADASKFIGEDWSEFVRVTIQMWEDYYMKWITMGKRILLIHFENLGDSDSLKYTLKSVSKFLNVEFDEGRFNCISKHPFKKFKREKKCLRNNTNDKALDTPSVDSYKNMDVFNDKHKVWIDSAIGTIRKAMHRRGVSSNTIQKYKNSSVKFNLC